MVQNARDAPGFLLQFDPVALSDDDMLNIYKKSYRWQKIFSVRTFERGGAFFLQFIDG